MTTDPMEELEKAHSNYVHYLIHHKFDELKDKHPYHMTRDELLAQVWFLGEELNEAHKKYNNAKDLIHTIAQQIRHGEWEV